MARDFQYIPRSNYDPPTSAEEWSTDAVGTPVFAPNIAPVLSSLASLMEPTVPSHHCPSCSGVSAHGDTIRRNTVE